LGHPYHPEVHEIISINIGIMGTSSNNKINGNKNTTMQGLPGVRDRVGLTEGLTNRYLRTNLAALASRFHFVSRDIDKADQTHGLHGRLEELLVFEILKDG
jgi:hypothetical protein